MADYKRLDDNGLVFFVNYLLTKLSTSSLAENTQYTIEKSLDGNSIILKDDDGNTISTITDNNTTYTLEKSQDGNSILLKDGSGTTISTISDNDTVKGVTVNGVVGTIDSQTGMVSVSINTSITYNFDYQTVASLPVVGTEGVWYMIPSGTAPNAYDEYVWVSSRSAYEKIGSTDVDLSGYVQASEMSTIGNAQITTIVDNAFSNVFGV